MPSLVRHANNYEVWRRLRDRFPHPYTHADAEQWIAFVQRQDPHTQFAIEVRGEATGDIGLEVGSDIERRTAEIGYWLGAAFWGKGIATAAVRAVTSYGFEALNLTCIFAVPLRAVLHLYVSWRNVATSVRVRCAGVRSKRVS